jgi:predicted SAM-dependent methyltransferase
MKIENRIEYLTEQRLLAYAPQAIKWVVHYLRAVKTERAIAKCNEQVMRKIRSSEEAIKLEMGSGPKKGINGWTTVDRMPGADLRFDLLEALPFRNDEVDEIYSSHVLEYFGYRDFMRVLEEWRRILRHRGLLRVALPNARIFLEAYLSNEDFNADYYCRYKPALHYHTRIDYVNYMAYMDAHRHMFDEENLVAVLKAAGFSEVKLRSFDPTIDMKEREFESIYAVAIK